LWLKASLRLENTHHKKRDGRMIQVVKLLLSKCEALSSNPRTTKKKKSWDVRLSVPGSSQTCHVTSAVAASPEKVVGQHLKSFRAELGAGGSCL
jgi:hypothetical protein